MRFYRIFYYVLFVMFISISVAQSEQLTLGTNEKLIPLRVDEKVQNLKSDIIKLGHDLALLEESASPVPGRNLIIYLSLDIEEGFTLKSVELELDNVLILGKSFNEKTIRAIKNGGIFRLYNKNIPLGSHEIKVRLQGLLGKNKNHENSTSFRIDKSSAAITIELKITNVREKFLPEFAVREWK